ncbi:DUF1707 domain-containing protein [Kribbella solani]|uniref:DUF1707 SHOCT-like domain-containing protein n=1 Tax=Kribbella solani TaxID=236067 RepID=UPI0029BEC9C6|nr:DUF1707 domain-containing protein [Kribbella solani]MDX2971081.1 DUF1707 domain-containing protein [Kribbella solani]MDX3004267.1 DUF1707 domain-containing protein [Kribbella solani]
MTASSDRDRRAAARAARREWHREWQRNWQREWQSWNGPGWNGSGWNGGAGAQTGRRGTSWPMMLNNLQDSTIRREDDGEQAGQRSDGEETGRRGGRAGKRLRIGDSERDRAVSALGEHFVAGRLTQAEFEERSEQATRARYVDDIEPLFDDLPASAEVQVAQPGWPVRGPRRAAPPPAFLMIAPFLMVGLVISSIALTAPWLLWGLFWIVLISGMSRQRWQQNRR